MTLCPDHRRPGQRKALLPHELSQRLDGSWRCSYCNRTGAELGIRPSVSAAAPAVHRDASDTEAAAADLVERTGAASRWKRRVYDALVAVGAHGATAAELHERFGGHDTVKLYTIAPRLTELKDDGLVVDSGRRRGRSIVWTVV